MVTLLLLALAAGPVPPSDPRTSILARASVGEWATYRADGGGGRISYLRLAVVGAQRDEQGREALWLEFEVGTHPELAAPIARIAVLAARSEGLTPKGVTRLIVGAGVGRPEELSATSSESFLPPVLASAGKEPRPLAPTVTLKSVVKTLATPAGSLDAACTDTLASGTVIHRLCVAPKVPLLGFVELSLPELGHSLRLHAYGTAASRRMPATPNRPSIGQER